MAPCLVSPVTQTQAGPAGAPRLYSACCFQVGRRVRGDRQCQGVRRRARVFDLYFQVGRHVGATASARVPDPAHLYSTCICRRNTVPRARPLSLAARRATLAAKPGDRGASTFHQARMP
jgi:hypothetical protein